MPSSSTGASVRTDDLGALGEDRLEPLLDPAGPERQAEDEADERSTGSPAGSGGTVIDGGDSWIFGSISGSTWLGPQNVMPISRNM